MQITLRSIGAKVLNRKQRLDTRKMAREAYIEANGDVETAKVIFKSKIKGYGSMLTMLMIASIMTNIAYTLFKFWRDTRVSVPAEEPREDEPIEY